MLSGLGQALEAGPEAGSAAPLRTAAAAGTETSAAAGGGGALVGNVSSQPKVCSGSPEA